MTTYYNEHDKFAAAWLRELIADGLIAPGEVDERSIEDVRPDELAGFVQCHFFAGIGIWSLALRQAGWPDDQQIWTGSCPCQPFSAAGKGGGFDDERHLWPAFHWLIEQCGPELVLGEQVASKDGLAWLDLVSADVEASGYAFGAADTCAAGFGAPHIRQRLYWMADASHKLDDGRRIGRPGRRPEYPNSGNLGRLANADVEGLALGSRPAVGRGAIRHEGQAPAACGLHGGLGHTELPAQERFRQHGGEVLPEQEAEGSGLSGASARGLAHPLRSGAGHASGQGMGAQATSDGSDGHLSRERLRLGIESPASERPGPLNGLWRDADWLCCTDGKWRPVAPGTFPLAPTGTVRNRVGLLRGAGNAINLAQAQGFIEAVMAVREGAALQAEAA